MRRIYSTLFICFAIVLITNTQAAFEPRDFGARSSSMGGVGGITADEIFSIPLNPSTGALLKQFTVGATGYQLFPELDGLEPIGSVGAGSVFPTENHGAFGIWVDTFGMDLYRENQFMFSYSFLLLRRVSLGFGMKVIDLEMKGYPSATAFSMDAGVTAVYSERLRFTFAMRNLNGPSLLGSSDNISRGGELGAAFIPLKGLLAGISLVKNTGEDISFRVGAEIKPWQPISIRVGGQIGSLSRFTTGLGLRFLQMDLDYGFIWQTGTGSQSVFSVSWGASPMDSTLPFNKEKKSENGTISDYLSEKININTATVDELHQIPGIGPATAKNIVIYREQHGNFKSVDELRNIPRFSEKTLAKIRDYVTADKPDKNAKGRIRDINGITLKELIDMDIPPLTAVKIIKVRDEKKGRTTIEDIKNIQGLSEAEFEQIKPVLLPLFKGNSETK